MSSFSDVAGNFGPGAGGTIVELTDYAGSSLCAAVAAEIRAIKTLIEQLADLLITDARFVTEYVDQFQLFDLMAQCADESASVLERLAEGWSAEEAVAGVRLTIVQQRLHAAIAGS